MIHLLGSWKEPGQRAPLGRQDSTRAGSPGPPDIAQPLGRALRSCPDLHPLLLAPHLAQHLFQRPGQPHTLSVYFSASSYVLLPPVPSALPVLPCEHVHTT